MTDDNYLSTSKVLQWMERTLNLALNDFDKENGASVFDVDLGNDQEKIKIYATVVKAHPAFTLKLKNLDGSINLDIDLVPCFQFTNEKWPKEGYRPNPFSSKNKFLIVPKKPHDMENCNIEKYWRLSFQEQERELIKGHEFKTMKPSIKLLKKLRDKQNHVKIASYFIKTIYLWEAVEQQQDFWKQSQSCVFMAMLKKYAAKIQDKRIPYFWNEEYNLIGHLKDATLTDIGNTLKNIIDDIEKNLGDPFIVGKYLINQDQVNTLRTEVDLGKKHKKTMITTQCLSRSSSSVSSEPTPPDSEEERIRRLICNDEFLQEISDYIAKNLRPKLYNILQPAYSFNDSTNGGNNESNEIIQSLSGLHSKTNRIATMMANLTDANENLTKTCNDLTEKVSSLENNMAELANENTELKLQFRKMTKVAANGQSNIGSVSDSAMFDRLALTAKSLLQAKNTEQSEHLSLENEECLMNFPLHECYVEKLDKAHLH